jgi:uncharacterized protein YkwD
MCKMALGEVTINIISKLLLIVMAQAAGLILIWFSAGALAQEPVTTCTQNYERDERFVCTPDEELCNAVVQDWSSQHHVKLSWDARYAQVARYWSEHLLQTNLPPERSLSIERLRFELRSRGVTDAAMLPFSAVGPVKQVPSGLLQFLNDGVASNRYTHFGLGVAVSQDRERMIMTILVGRRPARLEQVPVCPEPGARLDLRLRLREDYNYPRGLLGLPAGGVQTEELLYEAGVWRGKVMLDAGRGTYQLEIVVQGPAGPEVAALFPLYVGVAPAAAPAVKLDSAPMRYNTPGEAEQALIKLVNQVRAKQGLPVLQLDERLSAVAREHSLQLLIDRQAVHRTAASGALSDRLRKRKVNFVRALENVALGSSLEAAHERILESPGHRQNVLDAGVQRLGIGIAMERQTQEDILAVTEVFVEPPDTGDIATLAQRVHDIVNQTRKQKGLLTLGADEELSAVARQSARRLAMQKDTEPKLEGGRILGELQKRLGLNDPRIRYFRTENLRRVLAAPEVLEEDINRLGVGVAAATFSQTPGEYWIVLIFAGR